MGRFLLAVASWSGATAAATAFATSLARALCLPPYWPPGVAFHCRPESFLPALARLPLEVALTGLFLFFPALGPGLVAALVARVGTKRWRVAVAAVAAAMLWILLVERLEPGFLDFTISIPSRAIGAAAGWLALRRTVGIGAGRHPHCTEDL
jgi:hypothetical protein